MSAPLGQVADNMAAIPLAAVGLLTPMPAGAVVPSSTVTQSATASGCTASSRPTSATRTATARTTVPLEKVT